MLNYRKILSFLLIFSIYISVQLFAEEIGRAVIMGDSRSHLDIYKKITAKIIKQHPQVIFHTGDMVASGSNKAEWDAWDVYTRKLTENALLFPVRGNHDGSEKVFLAHYPNIGKHSWYSTDQIGLHWIILDTEFSLKIGSEQYLWLENDLKTNTGKIFVLLTHDPIFSSGPHGSGVNTATLIKLIDKYNIKLVFSGHDHIYERSFRGGTYYIVTGGGGAPLYTKSSQNPYSQFFSSTYHYCVLDNNLTEIHVDVYNLKDKKIDTITITK